MRKLYLAKHDVQIVISDQMMPNMTGSELFESIQNSYPDIVRILLTGHTAIDGITKAVNKGAVFRVLFKPWDDDHLLSTIDDAFKSYDVMEENRRLTTELKEFNKNLEAMVEKKTRELSLNVRSLHAAHRLFDNLPAFAMGVSDDQYVVEANLRAQLAFGGGPLVGRQAADILPDELFQLLLSTQSNEVHNSPYVRVAFGEVVYDFSCARFEIISDTYAYLIYGQVVHE